MTTPHLHRNPPVARSFRRNRSLLSALACAFIALISTLAWPASPAQAHTELRSTTPAAGAQLTGAPRQVRLVFNEQVEPGFSTMTLKVADSPPMTLTAREDGPAVIADVPSSAEGAQAAGGSAAWKVDYRVVADDGHPISGSISFGVASAGRPATSAPAPSSSAPSPTSATSTVPPGNVSATGGSTRSGDAQRPIPLLLLVGGGVAVAVGAAVWRSRTKPKEGSL